MRKTYWYTLKAFGHIVTNKVEAKDDGEAREKIARRHGFELTVEAK